MGFYDLSKDKRKELVKKIEGQIIADIIGGKFSNLKKYSSDSDTYIRKTAYLTIGKLYKEQKNLRNKILSVLKKLYEDKDEKIRQTVVYSFGEIGKIDINKISAILEKALYDEHHSVRNAVIGSLKQMGEKNPKPTLKFAEKLILHKDPKIRREIVHGIELRGRTHPEDILPLLKKLENDESKLVRDTIIHVLGQISYKKGCLEKVISELKKWRNKELIAKALTEIIEVHKRYEKFSAKTSKEAEAYTKRNF